MIPVSTANLIAKDYSAIQTELAYRDARANYYNYFLLSNHDAIPTRLHGLICHKIQDFIYKPNPSPTFDILLISMGPQHGKSKSITETLPSWYCGTHPDKDCIIVSYSDDTASRFGRANRAKLEEFTASPYDVVGPLFPNYKRGDVWTNNDICDESGHYIRSRGIFGGITGNPADLIIIDDPIKLMQEARSDTTKEAIWREYMASITTRIKPHGKLIVIATRWVEDDLIGRLMLGVSASRLTTLFLPCECIDPEHDPLGRAKGDALCPEIGRTNEWLKEFKAGCIGEDGLYTWSAMYQCDPTPVAGAIIDPAWWQWYEYSEGLEPDMTDISVDAAFHGDDKSDFVTIQVWSIVGENFYLRTQVHEHLTFTETMDHIRELTEQYDVCGRILIEDKANGSAVIDTLTKEYDNIEPVNPAGGKASRLYGCSPTIRKKRVYLPRGATWASSFISEFTSFPNGAHDDQVDATSQELNYRLYAIEGKLDTKPLDSAKIKIRVWTEDMYEDYYRANPTDRERLLKMYGYPKYGFNDEEDK